jgi:hypothetical protein
MAWKRQQVLMAEKQKREERKRNREVSKHMCAVAGRGWCCMMCSCTLAKLRAVQSCMPSP